jgi:hypothetical protein
MDTAILQDFMNFATNDNRQTTMKKLHSHLCGNDEKKPENEEAGFWDRFDCDK